MKDAIRSVILAAIGCSILGGCAHYFNLAVQDISVILQVVGNPKELKVTSPGSTNCKPANQGNGCVYVDKNETARIKFTLHTSPAWYLKTFKICKGNLKASQNCNLNVWERLEFTATTASEAVLLVPDANGIIDLAALSANDIDEFFLYDQNLFEQDYFYSIEACNTDPMIDCLWTDPPLENRGKGN